MSVERLDLGRAAPVYYTEELDSTNLALKRLAAEGAEDGTVLFCARQSAGRGRLGRSFASPEGGLYLSLLLPASEPPERDLSLTPGAAVAVCRAVEALSGLRCAVKWPNDLLLGGKKLCGILTEGFVAAGKRKLVLGVGVNVNTEAFPPELGEIAVSLRQLTGERYELRRAAELLTKELDALLALRESEPAALLSAYRALCSTPGQEILVLRDGLSLPARALAVQADYALLAEYPDGRRESLRYGEVSVRKV